MPGNQTIYKNVRQYLPIVWVDSNLPGNANRIMAAGGLPVGMNQIPVAAAGSVTSVVGMLSEVVTTGTLTLQLLKNGTAAGQPLTFTMLDLITKIRTFAPGTVVLAADDFIGMRVTTTTPFAPAGSIDVVVYVETQSI